MLERPDFLLALVRRRLTERYVGAAAMAMWAVLSPLIPLLINMIIFYFIADLPEVRSMGIAGYAAYAFTGLIAFRLLQRAIVEGCDLLISNLEMLRSVNFPLPYLSVASIGALLADLGIQFAFVLVLLLWSGHTLHVQLLGLPVAVLILVLLAIGASWLVSIAGYVARETQEVVNLGLTFLLYLSPAVYPIEAAPQSLRPFIDINPLTHLITIFRDALMPSGSGLHWENWAISAAMAVGAFLAGWYAINRLKRLVGDLV